MKIVLVRHGERDYAPCYERGWIGQGLELAPLTELGCNQAEAVADNPLLQGAQLIVSSPYTRALQTAAIISRLTRIPLTVEIDLHEWIVDLTFQNKAVEPHYGNAALLEFAENYGRYPEGEVRTWETIDMMSERAIRALKKYLSYDKIIVVTHGILMRQLKAYMHVPNCFADEIEFSADFSALGWWRNEHI
ncbi:MAG: histidine phosphatase family protein [Oscillospiraceae bacterium]|jgi:broad specificity phosphatase PhoE|nr:histidine phosphatase family protein [Oscillospiraceae bacterium]